MKIDCLLRLENLKHHLISSHLKHDLYVISMSESSQSESQIGSNSIAEKSLETLHKRGDDDVIEIPSSSNSSTDEPEEEDASLINSEPVKTTPSSYEKLDTRSKAERLLHHFVQDVHIEGIRKVIQRYPEGYHINAKSRNGYDLLTYSVIKGDLEVLRVILWEIDPENIETSGGLAMAVHLDKMEMVLEILSFEEKQESSKEHDDQKGESEKESQKTKNVHNRGDSGNELTPLMIAVLEKHFEMIEVLYERGKRMPMLHYPSCTCEICKASKESGEAKDSERIRKRIKLLEAMGSPEWLIFMTGQDGSWDPIHEAMLVKEKIERCMDEEREWKSEYEMVLRNVVEFPRIMITLCDDIEEVKMLLGGDESSEGIFPVVRQALNGRMKDFLAEPSVQFVVYQEFYGGIYGWRPHTTVERFAKKLLILLMVACLPLFSFLLWVKNLGGEGNRDHKEPLTRFLGSAESRYWMRFGSYLLFLGILIMVHANHLGAYEKDKPAVKIIFGLRGAVLLYVVSHGSILLKGYWRNSRYFFKCPWNKMELLSSIIFCVTFAAWFCENVMGWVKLSKQEENNTDDWYLFDQWSMIVHRIGKCSFALGVTLSVIQILRFTLLLSSLGRLQATFSRMVEGKWETILFYVILMSVSLSLSSWVMTRKSKFWKVKLYVWVLMLFSWIGLFVFLFLKVMLTGLCWTGLRCGSKVQENPDSEYKYQITMELMRYLEDKGLAPPFNLIPWYGMCGAASKSKIDATEERKNKYPYLLRKLSQRYFQKLG